LEKGNPEFDYGLEHVRAISRGIKSFWYPWGSFASGVLKEVNQYLSNNPPATGRSEAEYRAAVASYLRYRPEEPEDPHWNSAVAEARTHFANVAPGSTYDGASQAWQLTFDLIEAGDERKTLFPRVRQFASVFRDDEAAMQISGIFFRAACVEALWPIPINATDVDGKPVSLQDYTGRVLLIEFWSTACSPCMREIPHIAEVYRKYHDRGFDVLSISLDDARRFSGSEFREWVSAHEMTWRHIYDKEGWDGPLVGAYLVGSIPNPYLVGRDGNLIASGEECRAEALDDLVAVALRQKGP
jgi:thiol-disulfide isomerase/thioredoxin